MGADQWLVGRQHQHEGFPLGNTVSTPSGLDEIPTDAICLPASSTRLQTKMKSLRFSMKAVLALTALVAAALMMTRPFKPKIQFDAIPTSVRDMQNDNFIAGYDMILTNKSRFPIWLAASSETNPVHVHASGYQEKGNLSAATLTDTIIATGNKVHWICLLQNEPFTIHFEATLRRPTLLGLLVKDWRGCKAEAWSEPYIPPHLRADQKAKR